MKVTGFMLGWVVVKNLKESIKFYTEVMGLTLLEETPEYGWAELKGEDGMTLGLGEESDQMPQKAGSNAVMCLTVENLEEAIKHYKSHGATLIGDVIEVPGHVKMQSFKDKDGNDFQLVCKL